MKNIFNETYEALEDYFISINEKKYRATQLFDFLYKKRVYNLEQMNNISKETKEKIKKDYDFSFIKILKKMNVRNCT